MEGVIESTSPLMEGVIDSAPPLIGGVIVSRPTPYHLLVAPLVIINDTPLSVSQFMSKLPISFDVSM